MLVNIHAHATNEERGQLLAVLERITGAVSGNSSQSHITSVIIAGQEVIALESSRIDESSCALLRAQPAVARVTPIKTQYKLVSRACLSAGSNILVGNKLGGNTVTIGNVADQSAQPVIIAGPCAVESREQLLSTALPL